jgi:hypothetical protein
MKNAFLGIVGAVAGLALGVAGALAYSHDFGDGKLLADLQAQLDDAKARLAKSEADKKLLQEQATGEGDQLTQLVTSNESLKKQLASQGQTPVAAPVATPALNPALIGAIMGMMRGGPGRSPEQRMFLMQTRLKLSPDQSAKIKAAMDADQQARRDLFRQARENGTRPDAAAIAATNTLDKTLATVLSPAQQQQYQQLQSDEKAARAETSATQQVDQMMPLLQLTDDQKGKAMNAIYQQQLAAADPATLMANPAAAVPVLTSQGEQTQTALKSVLSPDQYAIYQQDQQVMAQAAANFGGGGRNRGNGNGGNGGGNNGTPTNGGGAPPAVAAAPAPAPAAAPDAAAATPAATTNAAPADGSATNAAPAAPPPPS